MAKILLRSGKIVGDFEKPYVVAEVNSSHNGNVDTAKQMIDAAVNAGCDCVKFQSWSAESLYSSTYYKANPISKRIVSKFSLSKDNLKILAGYCQERGIDFSSTPYSKEEVDFLVDECDAAFVKIASMDLNNYNYLRYIAKKNVPIILSTGMSSLNEVKMAVQTICDAGNEKLCLLHCISIYPPEFRNINLRNILGLREIFPEYPIGFSDHSHGVEMSVAATAFGAAILEKHLTLDCTKIGMDNQMATEPEEMQRLVQCCINTQLALGHKERVVSEAELEQIKKMRRSVIVTKKLLAGHVLSAGDLDAKRPGSGIPADKINDLVGMILVNDKDADTVLNFDDVAKSG